MPTERLPMGKVREVLRLKHAVGLSYREISEATRVGKTAVVGIHPPRGGDRHYVASATVVSFLDATESSIAAASS
jgi:hypothetical protein